MGTMKRVYICVYIYIFLKCIFLITHCRILLLFPILVLKGIFGGGWRGGAGNDSISLTSGLIIVLQRRSMLTLVHCVLYMF